MRQIVLDKGGSHLRTLAKRPNESTAGALQAFWCFAETERTKKNRCKENRREFICSDTLKPPLATCLLCASHDFDFSDGRCGISFSHISSVDCSIVCYEDSIALGENALSLRKLGREVSVTDIFRFTAVHGLENYAARKRIETVANEPRFGRIGARKAIRSRGLPAFRTSYAQ
jgi:hypothetical protein